MSTTAMNHDSQVPLPTGPLPIPVRFVILHHTGLDKGITPEHFDLMIQFPGVERLATWRILPAPETWQQHKPPAERLSDHRIAYLTYEGPISGGRGSVTRVAEGVCEFARKAGRCHLSFPAPLSCEFELSTASPD